MKKTLITFALLWSAITYSQSFEGTLTYATDIDVSDKVMNMGITREALIDQMKLDGSYSDTVSISYKQGNYFTLMNSNPKSWAIYNSETNKIYAMQDGEAAGICTVTDASIDTEYTITGEMPIIQKLDSTVIIDEYTCSIVRVKWKGGAYDYYYAPGKFTVDHSLFAKHIYEGWANFLKISNSLPIKIVKTSKNVMTITMNLVLAKVEKIDESKFTIPSLIPDEELNQIKLGNREVMRIKE